MFAAERSRLRQINLTRKLKLCAQNVSFTSALVRGLKISVLIILHVWISHFFLAPVCGRHLFGFPNVSLHISLCPFFLYKLGVAINIESGYGY